MINIRKIVRGGINSINPDIYVVILPSDGFEVDDYREQTPKYLSSVGGNAQVQPVPSEELKHINNYNSSSIYYDVYLTGSFHGLNRALLKGGDLVYFEGFEWLVLSVPENFSISSGWVKLRVIQQKLATAPVVL